MSLTIVIPAAGLGRRMKSYGPKALIEVAPRQTLIGRQLWILREHFPRAELVVVVGFEAEKVARTLPAWVRVVKNEQYEVTNVARSVEMGLRVSRSERVLVVYGDLVFSPGTFAGLPMGESFALLDTQGQLRELEVGCTVVDGEVTYLSYGLPTKWAQIMLLTGRELALFRRLALPNAKRKHFGYEILNEVLEHDGRLAAIEPVKMKLVEIDTSKDIAAARQAVVSA